RQDSETDVDAAEQPGDDEFRPFPVQSFGAFRDRGSRFIDQLVFQIEVVPARALALLLLSHWPSVSSASGRMPGIRLRCRRASGGRTPRTGEREPSLSRSALGPNLRRFGVGFGPCSRMFSRHVRGWFRVFSGLGSGLVSWLVGSVTVVTGAWASFELHDADRLV